MARRDIELVRGEVEDPYFNPAHAGGDRVDTVTVTINIRESSIAQMHARGQIDDPQCRAADRFRNLCERAGLNGLQAVDISRERVDNASGRRDPADCRLDALRELTLVARELGKIGYPVCVAVCADRMSVRELATRMMGRAPKKRELDYYGRLLRDHLDLLCSLWGYKQRAR